MDHNLFGFRIWVRPTERKDFWWALLRFRFFFCSHLLFTSEKLFSAYFWWILFSFNSENFRSSSRIVIARNSNIGTRWCSSFEKRKSLRTANLICIHGIQTPLNLPLRHQKLIQNQYYCIRASLRSSDTACDAINYWSLVVRLFCQAPQFTAANNKKMTIIV